MPHFKDSENKLYWLDDGVEPAVWLPQCTLITDEEAEIIRPKPPTPTYKGLRAAEYPSIPDQFDLLYHGGMEAWKAAIQTIKDKYPKV